MESKKIAHLHLEDPYGNPETLVCRLENENESMVYIYFSGWNSSGTPFSLSNLQCTLPLYPEVGETEDMFVDRLVRIIDTESVRSVEKKVPVKIQFTKA